jgi:hypothetical protein
MLFDTFTLLERSDFSAINITLPIEKTEKASTETKESETNAGEADKSETAAQERTLTLKKSPRGMLEMFPWWDGEDYLQIKMGIHGERIGSFTAERDGFNFKVEILEYNDGYDYRVGDKILIAPSIARISVNGAYMFVSFVYQGTRIIETWFSDSGKAQSVTILDMRSDNPLQCAAITIKTNEDVKIITYSYDSFGNKAAMYSQRGIFRALYDSYGIKYRILNNRQKSEAEQNIEEDSSQEENSEEGKFIQSYEYQLNEKKLLVRAQMNMRKENADMPLSGDNYYYVYDYTFDSQGNWIEREELTLKEQFDLLLPVFSRRMIRKIEYR